MNSIPLRPTETDLRALLVEAMRSLEVQAAAMDVSVLIEAPDGFPRVTIDPEKIAWAVTTLVGNALRYVKHGSRLVPGGSVVVRLGHDAQAITIAVEDDGPGIPAEKLPWLFRRAPGASQAAGLALSMIHEVVVAHGGSVDVESATTGPARGTRIALRLPRAISESHGGAAEP